MSYTNLINTQSVNSQVTKINSTGIIATNITQASLGSISSLKSLAGSLVSSQIKTYEVIETTKDLLSASVALQRLKKDDTSTLIFGTDVLVSDKLLDQITSEDIDIANKIRDYYSKKIMVIKLRTNNLSKFREDLNKFVHSNTYVYKKDMLPLIYRLPEFYEYDTTMDKLRENLNDKIQPDQIKSRFVQTKKTLKFLQSFIVGKSGRKIKEFWFSDEQNNLVNIFLSKDNPLMNLFEKQLSNPITITGDFVKKHRDNYEYLRVEKYSF